MKKGFTLIELLAVIVIIAIIALIATPIVLSIIKDSRESSGLRSAEMYLDAVEQAVSIKKMNNTSFNPNSCDITKEGILDCEGYEDKIKVEVKGEKPINGNITFEEGKIKEVRLEYKNDKVIIKDENGNLVYEEANSDSGELDLSTVNTNLATNTWEEVQKIVKAGKVAEAGWSVGDTKTLTINGQTKTATLIGISHDGEQTATFMITESIGSHNMNSASGVYEHGYNFSGWKDSEMRSWLNGDIYNSMTDTKDYIKTVSKQTDNVGYSDSKTNTADDVTATDDKVFLLSVKEIGLQAEAEDWDWHPYMNQINGEGTTYEWFNNGGTIDDYLWLRSPYSIYDYLFFVYDFGDLVGSEANIEYSVCPAFVIG